LVKPGAYRFGYGLRIVAGQDDVPKIARQMLDLI